MTCQFLWIDGTNDFAFSLEMVQKSVACPKTPSYRATRVRMGHGHGAVSEETPELAAFADFKLKKAAAHPFVRSVSEIASMVNAEFDAVADPIQRAELNWTSDTCAGIDREWKSVEADVEHVLKIAIGGLPAMRPTSVRILDKERDLVETDDFAWSGDVLTLRKAHPDSAVFLIALERITE